MSPVLTWARLSFRLQRLELLLLVVAVLAWAGIILWLAAELNGLSASHSACDFAGPAPSCPAAARRFESMRDIGHLLMSGASLVVLAVGLFIGVPPVAREIEHGTAQLAWTIGRSRARWLIGRVALPMLVGTVAFGLLAVMTDVLAAAMRPDIDTSRAFWFYGGRGPLLVGRGLLAIGVAMLIGAVMGRQLPALLLAAVAVGGMLFASEIGFRRWHETEAVLASPDDHLSEPLGIDSGVVLPSGERVPYGMAGAEFQDENGDLYASEADYLARRNSIGREYQLIIPGSRYGEVVARETAVLAGGGALLIAASARVTSRRRPT